MPRNKLKRYTGAEVAQPKSIAEQLLVGTKLGNPTIDVRFYLEFLKSIHNFVPN